MFERLGFESRAGEGERTPTLRASAISVLGTLGADAAVRAEAAARFDAAPVFGGNGDPIPVDVEGATLSVVAQLVRPGDYDKILERYRSAATPQEEVRSLQVLATFPDIALAERSFDLAMTEVRSQNGYFVIGGLLANPVAGQVIWGRVTEAWDAILARFPKNVHSRLVEAIPTFCGDADFAHEVVAFLDAHPLTSGPRRVAQSIERLGVNVAFAGRERDNIADAARVVVGAADAARTS